MKKSTASAAKKRNMMRHRRRYGNATSAALLLTLALTPLTSARRVVQRARGRRMELKELDVEFFDDLDYKRQKPGLVFFEDGQGLEEFEAHDWTREFQTTTRNGDEWQWRSKGKGSTSNDSDCDGKGKGKGSSDDADGGKGKGGKGKGGTPSPSVSNAPSLSRAPTDSPSQSLAPSAGPSDSTAPSDLPTAGPSLSQVPSGSPSLSFQPSISNRPSSGPSVSALPSVSFSPTPKSTKAPTLKSTKAPTLRSTKGPTRKSTKSPTTKSSKSARCAPSAVPTMTKDGTAAPSASVVPSSSPSISASPSLSFLPSISTSPSGSPSLSNRPTGSTSPPSISRLPSISEAPSGSPSAVPSIVPTDSSDASSKGSPDVISLSSPDDDTCDSIAERTEPAGTTIDSTFTIRIPVGYRDGAGGLDPAGVIAILRTLQVPVALWVAGCEDEAEDFLRRLQKGKVDYVEMAEWSDETTTYACTPPAGATCGTFETDITVDKDEDVTDDVLEARIQRAMEIFQDKILSDPNIVSFPTDEMVIEGPDDFNAIQDGDNAVGPEGIGAGSAVGIAAAGLAFLLLLILLIRRRQEEDEPSHLKLEDEGNEATFIREFETDPSSDGDSPYKTRNIHVIGEADSVISGWTGYTRDMNNSFEVDGGVPGKLGHAHGDVHICSSATCEVCELRRQNGVQFQPTGQPHRSHLPVDASREYLADDTVELQIVGISGVDEHHKRACCCAKFS